MRKSVYLFTIGLLSLTIMSATAHATDIYGTISTTLTITENSKLVGPVMCNVVGVPCIKFGAPHITLWLNGQTINGLGVTGNGRGQPVAACVPGSRAIDTNGQNNVAIQGPGLIGEFAETGILVSGSRSLVNDVVISSMCVEGIRLLGSQNTVQQSVIVRASLSGDYYASIFVSGTGSHVLIGNQTIGAGPAPLSSNNGNLGGHGIFVGGLSGIPSNNNLIQGNITSGNAGSGIFIADPSTGYPISKGNIVVGNTSFGNVLYDDIFDNNTAGSNKYFGNRCEVSAGTDAPACHVLW